MAKMSTKYQENNLTDVDRCSQVHLSYPDVDTNRCTDVLSSSYKTTLAFCRVYTLHKQQRHAHVDEVLITTVKCEVVRPLTTISNTNSFYAVISVY